MTKIKIVVNGETVKLSEFPSEIIISVIVGMLQTLRGVEEIKTAEIKIEEE